jgi:hypothetical protein
MSFIQLLRASSRIFSVQGRGPVKFVKKARGLGRIFLPAHMAAVLTA